VGIGGRPWGVLADLAAGMVVVAALLLPDRLTSTDLGSFAAVPVELMVGAVLLMVAPSGARRALALLLGLVLGALTLLKIVDSGFYAALSRPFDLVLDWRLAGGAWELLAATLGVGGALIILAAVLLVVVSVPVIMIWATTRLAGLLDEHPSATRAVVVGLTVVWLACAAVGLRAVPPYPVASRASTTKLVGEVLAVRERVHDREAFAAQAAQDRYADVAVDELLAGLAGRPVVLVFVESYGRTAVEDPGVSPEVVRVLDAGTDALADAGLRARSGYLTSPIVGGGSWLAHATLLSGLWIENQQRYQTLVASDRFTLTQAFQRAGWRTVGVMPGMTSAWPEGVFYGYDEIHDAGSLGYAGPSFGWARIPDQYTLAVTRRASAPGTDARPTMTVVPLVSSHAPWTPVPPLMASSDLGDGSAYGTAHGPADPPEAILRRDPERVRVDYAASVAYALRSVIRYAHDSAEQDPLIVVVGDHQPSPIVTGAGAGRDVPVTLISGDPELLGRVADWGWTPGLRPAPDAPVWRMDTFRNRFLAAFGKSGS
jgi:hypothetical protein